MSLVEDLTFGSNDPSEGTKMDSDNPKSSSRRGPTAAFSETGTVLEPDEGLRRFLIQTRDDIATDKSHFTEELFSDIFALVETGVIVADGMEGDFHHLEEDTMASGFAVVSAVAAVYLLSSLNKQRAAKEIEYRKALKMFVEFEKDKVDTSNGENREERYPVAVENLRDKMRHSGLQFVELPDEQRKFNKSEFKALASEKGIGETLTKNAIQKTGSFLRKPLNEKMLVTGESLSRLEYRLEKGAKFMGHVLGQYLSNPFRARREILPSTIMGFKEASALNKELRDKRLEEEETELAGERAEIKAVIPLTLERLKHVNVSSIKKIGKAWRDEDRDDLITIMRDQERHEVAARRARNSLVVQSVFEVAQLALIPIKLFDDEKRHTVWMNFYSFFAAMGPLKGFADELKSERAKVHSKLAEKAEHLGKMMDIDAHTLTSEEKKKIQESADLEPEDYEDHEEGFVHADEEMDYEVESYGYDEYPDDPANDTEDNSPSPL